MSNRTGKRERKARNRHRRRLTTLYLGPLRIEVKAGRKKSRRIWMRNFNWSQGRMTAVPVADAERQDT